MPGGRTKFNNVWLSAIDSNGQKLSSWCRKGLDDFHAYCQFCDKEFLCDNSGKSQILQHAKKAKHVQAVKPSIDESQGKLFVQSHPVQASQVAVTCICQNRVEVLEQHVFTNDLLCLPFSACLILKLRKENFVS